MPKLINNVTFSFGDQIGDRIGAINNVQWGVAEAICGHIKLGSFEGFVFNYKQVISIEEIADLRTFGMTFNINRSFTELEISY